MPLSNARHDILGQRRLTREHGEFVTLYRVMPCSCKRNQEGHPDPTCKVCGGSGRAYSLGEQVKGLIAGLNSQDKTLMVSGVAMPGDMTFSPDVTPMIPIHDYDVLRLRYGQPYEGDVLVRGQDDEMNYVPHAVLNVERHDPASGVRSYYEEGIDFTISDRTIVWLAGKGPASGQSYSVKYHAIYDWVAYPGVTMQRVKRGTSLGQRVLLRKRHLAGVKVIIPTL
jgi:hypothetical protein